MYLQYNTTFSDFQWLTERHCDTECKILITSRLVNKIIGSIQDVTVFRLLKVLNQFECFASLISNLFCEKPNLPSIHCNMLARLCNFCMKFLKNAEKLRS